MTPSRLLDDVLGLDLPLAELCAARLDGDIAQLGFSFTPIDVPVGVATRARSLSGLLPERFIADRRTAAWVYGATERLPPRLEACVSTAARPSALARFDGARFDGLVREVVITSGEVLTFDGVLITSPLRTVFDLLRTDPFDADTVGLIRRLAELSSITRHDCEQYLARRAHLPGKTETLRRLGRVFVQRTTVVTPR